MNELDLMKEIATASNQGDQQKLSKIIMDNDFEGKNMAVTIAISGFNLTEENVHKNIEAAKKLANLDEPSEFRESMRHSILNEMLKT